MAANARIEEFEHVELFDKPALFTNDRIDRSTVPEGWYCYDFRGSDSDPGKLNYIELRVGVNHSGAVLLPEELDLKGKDYRRVRGSINFLGDKMTLREFCEVHQLPYPEEDPQFDIRPARPDEAGLFCAQRQNVAQEKSLVGRVTYVGDDPREFTDVEAFLKCIREELPQYATTGFCYKVLTNDPAVRKVADDIAFDLYGEENPHQLEDYEPQPDSNMALGGM